MQAEDWYALGIAVIFCGVGVILETFTKNTARWCGVGLIVLGLVCLSGWGYYRATAQQPTVTQTGPNDLNAPNNTGIVAPNNSGIIAPNNSGTINPAPPAPRYQIVEELAPTKNDDGTYIRTAIFDIISEVPLNSLLVEVKKADVIGNGMVNFSVGPWRTGIAMATNGEHGDFFWVRLATPAAGRYAIHLKVANLVVKPTIHIALNQ